MKTMSFFKSGSFCFLPGGYTTVIMEQTNCTQQPWCNLRQKPLTRRKPSPVCRHTMNSFQAANTQQYTVLGFHSKLVFSGRLENVPSKTTVSPPTKDSFVPPFVSLACAIPDTKLTCSPCLQDQRLQSQSLNKSGFCWLQFLELQKDRIDMLICPAIVNLIYQVIIQKLKTYLTGKFGYIAFNPMNQFLLTLGLLLFL